MSNASKPCSKCGQVKSLDEFWRCRDGFQSACKDCQKATLYQVKYPPDPALTSKRCTRCQQVKPVSEFHLNSQVRSGLQSRCKVCKSEMAKLAYLADSPQRRERRAEQARRWQAANPEKAKEIARRSRAANPEKRRAAWAAWASKNQDWLKEYERNRDRKPDPEARRKANREYRQRNPDKLRDKTRSWRARNRDRAREQVRRRRAIKMDAATYDVTAKDLRRLMESPCVSCGGKAGTVDHVIPITRKGGTHGIGNLAPMCQRCNSTKSNRTITEWRRAYGWFQMGHFQ